MCALLSERASAETATTRDATDLSFADWQATMQSAVPLLAGSTIVAWSLP